MCGGVGAECVISMCYVCYEVFVCVCDIGVVPVLGVCDVCAVSVLCVVFVRYMCSFLVTYM